MHHSHIISPTIHYALKFPSKDFDEASLDHVKEAPVRLWGPMAVITAVMVSVTFWSTPLFNFLETVAKGVF